MNVSCELDAESSNVTVASLSGNLEELGARRLWEVLETHLNTDTPSMIIEMAGVDLITSAGVGTLIRILTRAKSLDGSLAVYGCSDRVRKVIEIVRIGELLGLSETLQEARGRLHPAR
jgi:anti-anti-sigma factor